MCQLRFVPGLFYQSTKAVTITIPGYKIERLLAEGGMATVYLATQESLGRYVALKLLRKFDNPTQAKRFLNEGQIIASLNHRNIITIHDLGVTEDERPYISMEYLEGGDLEARIRKAVAPDDALKWLEALGDCLDFVHQKGIIHRDIKPANILFHKDGTPILSDFGVAKQEKGDVTLTMDGSAFGSPYYLSPEQAECKKLDGRADIYGLGIILYEMLTGDKPYKGESHIETIVAHLSDPLPILPQEAHRYQALLNKMIAKSPDDRFTSAGEMAHSIRQLRAPETVFFNSILDNKPIHSLRNWWSADRTGAQFQALRIWLEEQLMSRPRLFWTLSGLLATVLLITVILLTRSSNTLNLAEQVGAKNPAVTEKGIDLESDKPGSNIGNEESLAKPVDTPHPAPDSLAVEPHVPSSDNSQRIKELLSQANSALEAYRLTVPVNNNAYDYYQQVLELHPEHEEAIKGIDRVVNAYADLAEGEIADFNYDEAKKYVRRGLRIQPDNPRLQKLERNTNVLVDAPSRVFGKIKSLFE